MRGLLLQSGAQGRAPCAERQVARRNFVGWAKALAQPLHAENTIVRHAHYRNRHESHSSWWARRTRVLAVDNRRASAHSPSKTGVNALRATLRRCGARTSRAAR